MDKCGICSKQAKQLFETAQEGLYACFKCQPLVPEVTIEDNVEIVQDNSTQEELQIPIEGGIEIAPSLYCGVCHKQFDKQAQLTTHMRNHKAEKRFVCTYCNKAFSQSNNLRAHLRIHTNERPYKCDVCDKAFTQVTNLNNHVRLHTGERPFACDEPGCDKAFAQVTNLNQHRKRHMSGRPVETTYDCNVCGQQFAQRNHMYTHRREEHAECGRGVLRAKSYQCELCDVTVTSESKLRQHVESHATTNANTNGTENDTNNTETYSCVFKACGAVLSSAHEHTEHLLRAHQLRVLAARANDPPKRGRPPKVKQQQEEVEHDPLEFDEDDIEEVAIIEEQIQIVPRLKIKSMFQ